MSCAWHRRPSLAALPSSPATTTCAEPGDGSQDPVCFRLCNADTEDCGVGLSCLTVSSGGIAQKMCLKLCTIGPASGCATGQTGVAATGDPNTLGSTQYGWCVL